MPTVSNHSGLKLQVYGLGKQTVSFLSFVWSKLITKNCISLPQHTNMLQDTTGKLCLDISGDNIYPGCDNLPNPGIHLPVLQSNHQTHSADTSLYIRSSGKGGGGGKV